MMRKVTEVSNPRLGFLLTLVEAEAVVPEKDAQTLAAFLRGLGLQDGKHFSVSHVRVWVLFEWSWWARFRLLKPISVRVLQRRGFNRTRVEVLDEDSFVASHLREAQHGA
jgi:hypothetical protein